MTKTYQVIEIGTKLRNTEIRVLTKEEMDEYLKSKMEYNYGPRKDGFDPKYSIVAWEINKNGYGYVDFERIWKIWG